MAYLLVPRSRFVQIETLLIYACPAFSMKQMFGFVTHIHACYEEKYF